LTWGARRVWIFFEGRSNNGFKFMIKVPRTLSDRKMGFGLLCLGGKGVRIFDEALEIILCSKGKVFFQKGGSDIS